MQFKRVSMSCVGIAGPEPLWPPWLRHWTDGHLAVTWPTTRQLRHHVTSSSSHCKADTINIYGCQHRAPPTDREIYFIHSPRNHWNIPM